MSINPENTRNPNDGPPVDAPIYLSHEEHSFVIDPLRQLHREVEANSSPDTFSTRITGISLEGTPPAYLSRLSHYQKLGLSAIRRYGEDASLDITLIGRDPKDQVIFSSSPHHVDFAHHKIFTVRQGTDVHPSSHMNFDDLAYLLCEFVPISSFSELSDPRSGETFDEATLTMSNGLEAIDRNRKDLSFTDRRGFSSVDERLHGDNMDFITQRSAQLLFTKNKRAGGAPKEKLAIEISAPLQIYEHLVRTIFRYTLDVPTDRKQPLRAGARLALRSTTASRTDLEWALKARQSDIEPVRLIQDAIDMVRRDHTDKR